VCSVFPNTEKNKSPRANTKASESKEPKSRQLLAIVSEFLYLVTLSEKSETKPFKNVLSPKMSSEVSHDTTSKKFLINVSDRLSLNSSDLSSIKLQPQQATEKTIDINIFKDYYQNIFRPDRDLVGKKILKALDLITDTEEEDTINWATFYQFRKLINSQAKVEELVDFVIKFFSNGDDLDYISEIKRLLKQLCGENLKNDIKKYDYYYNKFLANKIIDTEKNCLNSQNFKEAMTSLRINVYTLLDLISNKT